MRNLMINNAYKKKYYFKLILCLSMYGMKYNFYDWNIMVSNLLTPPRQTPHSNIMAPITMSHHLIFQCCLF